MRLPGRSLADAVSELLQSPRGVIASLAGSSLAWGGTPVVLGGRLTALEDLVAGVLPFATVGVASVVTVDAAAVGVAFEWVLFGYLVFRLLPRLLPADEPAGPVLESGRFRLLAVASVVALAQPLGASLPVILAESVRIVTVDSARDFLGLFVVWVLVSWGAVGGYLYREYWRTASPDDRIDFVDQMTGDAVTSDRRADERADLRRDDWVGPTSSGFLLLGASGKVVVMCSLLAFVAALGSMLFPLVETLVLVGILTGTVADRRPSSRFAGALEVVADRTGDVESRFYELVRHVRTSRKGTAVVVLVVFGFVVSTLLVLVSLVALVAVAFVVGTLVTRPSAGTSSPLAVWNALGFLCSVVTPGLYSLWFWTRVAVRVPAFLVDWEQSTPGVAALDADTDRPDRVTRPPYALLPPTLLLVPVAVATGVPGPAGSLAGGNYLYAVGWPVLFGLVVWSVLWTVRAPPQPASTDGRALPVAFLVQLAWLVALGYLFGDGLAFAPWAAVAVGLFGLLAYYTPEFEVRLAECGVTSVYALLSLGVLYGVVLVGFAAVQRVVSAGVPTSVTRFLVAGGALLVAFSLLGALLSRLADET